MTLLARGVRPYDQLTDNEREFVDRVFSSYGDGLHIFDLAKDEYDIKLLSHDACENAVDAFATWVIASRAESKVEPEAEPSDYYSGWLPRDRFRVKSGAYAGLTGTVWTVYPKDKTVDVVLDAPLPGRDAVAGYRIDELEFLSCIQARDAEDIPDHCPVHGESWPCGGDFE